MATRNGLRRRILTWLLVYVSLLSVAIFIGGLIVNEEAERMVWESLLRAELHHYQDRLAADPTYRWTDTDDMTLYRWDDAPPPPKVLRVLPPGLHDDLWVEGKLRVVMVQDLPGGRVALALDITEFEGLEETISSGIVVGMFAAVILLGLLLAWGLGRAIRPLSVMAGDIGRLQPERGRQRIEVEPRASDELRVIADAFNDYLNRSERFVERERAFINSASHELRTPIAVIGGAARLAHDQGGMPAAAREQMQRILRSVRQIEQLISLLLILAKDPERLAAVSDTVSLDELLPEIVEDHRHLTHGKDLALHTGTLPAVRITAPLAIVQAAIGNLLRNAIENSDRGVIDIRLDSDATVTIADPGHGMGPEEISRIYAQLARGEGRDGGGIGLDLIARLCEHLGWRLDIDSAPERGTLARLHFHP
nr:HAMP domain-containing sensor histidine kinase [Pseudoxanthomonas sp.]